MQLLANTQGWLHSLYSALRLALALTGIACTRARAPQFNTFCTCALHSLTKKIPDLYHLSKKQVKKLE